MPKCKLPKTWFKDAQLCPHGYSQERTKNPKPEWCSGCEYYEEIPDRPSIDNPDALPYDREWL
jgi:hypothetical protein